MQAYRSGRVLFLRDVSIRVDPSYASPASSCLLDHALYSRSTMIIQAGRKYSGLSSGGNKRFLPFAHVLAFCVCTDADCSPDAIAVCSVRSSVPEYSVNICIHIYRILCASMCVYVYLIRNRRARAHIRRMIRLSLQRRLRMYLWAN